MKVWDKIKSKFRFYEKSQIIGGFAFCAVWIIGFLVFTAYPIIQTLIYSFNNVTVTTTGIEMKGVGFANYVKLLSQDSAFSEAIKLYVGEMLVNVPVIVVFALILAMVLNSRLKFKGVFRSIFFLPVIITSGPVFKLFIDQGVASFPGAEDMLNFSSLSDSMPQFVVNALQTLTSGFIMLLWFSGIQVLVFLTGLQKIDTGMYEAASIDGASKWEVFWKLVLPSLLPIIVINIVFTVVMQSVFALNPIIEKIGKDRQGEGFGYASAETWVYTFVELFVLAVFIALILFLLGRKKKVKTKTYR